jgi:hypothetical protein
MLDTVRIVGPWPAHERIPARRYMRLGKGVQVRTDNFGEEILWAEASLPRLLFGHNGRVLENQEQIDQVLNKLCDEIADVAIVPPVSELHARRIDIAWNLLLPARSIIMAHSYVRVRNIHRGATRFPDDTGISWRGRHSQIVLTMYDKAKEMRVPGSVLRVELSLRNNSLRQRLPNGHWRRFESLWCALGEVLSGIPPIQGVREARDWIHAIAPESKEVRARVLARLGHKSDRTRRRYAQLMEIAAAEIENSFSWSSIIGMGLPSPVHLEPIRPRSRNGI